MWTVLFAAQHGPGCGTWCLPVALYFITVFVKTDDYSECVRISESWWEQTLVKSYFVFLSLATANIFFDKAVQRCQIWQWWFIFITTFAVISIFFFWFCPPAFSLLSHSHLILPPPSFLPLPCFVSLRFFHCHIVLLRMPHTFCQWSLCSGWKPRRPCIAAHQAAGDQGFLSFQLLLKQHWLVSLAAAEKAGTWEQQIQHVLLAPFQ